MDSGSPFHIFHRIVGTVETGPSYTPGFPQRRGKGNGLPHAVMGDVPVSYQQIHNTYYYDERDLFINGSCRSALTC